MADERVAAQSEYNAALAADDILYMVDVSDTTDHATGTGFKVKAQRFATTDGNAVAFTGGGTIALAGFTVTAAATGTICDLASAQTLTNKTFTLPTIGDFTNATHDHSTNAEGGLLHSGYVTLTATQTLTNKTLTVPTIGDFTNAQHDHSDAASGGAISANLHDDTKPANSSSTGTKGEIRMDSDYIYLCVATNTWKRDSLDAW